jgi:hypothetical protein
MHAWSLRLRRVWRGLAMASLPVLPSAMLNDVGTLVAIISQLNALPACAPVNASMVALRLATHDSGSGWFATPFPYDSFIHNSTPVYPGALNSLLDGIEHSVEVMVDSLYEAIAQGLSALRDADWVGDIGSGQATITVVVNNPKSSTRSVCEISRRGLNLTTGHRQRWR